WHGIWGGYSYESKVIGNVFGLNAEAIAWEHGQDNLVQKNTFYRDNMGINLWANPSQDPNWGYAKQRDPRSRDWTIRDNLFSNIVGDSLRLRRTENVKVESNRFVDCPTPFRVQELVKNFVFADIAASGDQGIGGTPINSNAGAPDLARNMPTAKPLPATMQPSGNPVPELYVDEKEYLARFDVGWRPFSIRDASRRDIQAFAPPQLEGGIDPFIKKGQMRGRRYILVDEWGPYDFKSPLLWPRGVVTRNIEGMDGVVRTHFELLGPAGRAKLVKKEGVFAVEGLDAKGTCAVPGSIEILQTAGKAGNVDIQFDYVGQATTDYRGIITKAGTPVRFGFKRFFAPIDWTVKFYQWSQQTDPKDPHSPPVPSHIRDIFAGTPLKVVKTDRLDYASGGAFVSGLPENKFATVADGSFSIPAGDYVLEVTTDDGARVWVDGRQVIDNAWKYQGPTSYTANLKLSEGHHTIKIEHFEIDGYAALKVNLKPR
ncbi:MAG TPA: PA14 domain-containing protein, partial [Fimbriimonas sp.]|nr:PA14 domain-containing protein [Fimbriimonas sp.]